MFEKPNRRVTASTTNFYNRQKIHSIVLHEVCDCDKCFWNVFASQPKGVVDGGSFKLSSLSRELRSRIFLTKPVVDVGGVQVLLGDATYPLGTYFYTLTMMQIEHYISLH